MKSAAVPLLKESIPQALKSPMVSIIVPVYNVEVYIEECLQSLVGQTLHDIEIIVVDDCSPDRSMDIVERFASRDRRIKIVRQRKNAGLGAARNAGVAKSRGRYLCFIDSDDVLRAPSCADVSAILESTGSDFAVFGYERFNSSRAWRAAPWITQLHESTQTKITAAEHPEIMANTISCSKFYRRTFWDRHQLSFPVGVKYEDQPVLATAYAVASSIDVIGEVYLRWRAREDGSSITQQLGSHDDLRERLEAADTSLANLRRNGSEGLAQARLAQLLANDFPFSVAAVPRSGPEYWEILVRGIRRLFDYAQDLDHVRDNIPPQSNVPYDLVLRDDRANVLQFFEQGGGTLRFFPTEVIDGVMHVCLPFYGDEKMGIPRSRYAVLPRQRKLITAVRRVHWGDAQTIVAEGWAYIANLDHDRYPPVIRATLVERRSGARVNCPVSPRRDPEVSRISKHQWSNYEGSAFRLDIDVSVLLADDQKSASWDVLLEVSAGGIEASSLLHGKAEGGSAAQTVPHFVPDGTRAVARFAQQDFGVDLSRVNLRLVDFGQEGRKTRLTLESQRGKWKTLRLAQRGTDNVINVPLTAVNGQLEASFELPDPQIAPPASAIGWAPPKSKPWIVRAVQAHNDAQATIAWLPEGTQPSWTDPRSPRLFRTRASNVGLDETTTMVDITDVHIGAESLDVTLRVAGRALDDVQFLLMGSKTSVDVRTSLVTGINVITLPLTSSIWGGPELPLPLGRYHLRVAADTDADQSIQVDLDQSLVSRLPIPVFMDRLHARVERTRDNKFVLVVIPPLALDERGSRQQRELQTWHATLEPTPARRTALFRAYYGENTACNAGAVDAELRRMSSDVQVIWAVTDHSVPVPTGRQTVIHESRDWYRLLRNAEFVMDNTHQPIYHVKAPHQRVIQTFHGYPFKVMGHQHWEQLGLSQARIESFDRRAAEWDYLVSPATYATPLLRRDFRYDGNVLDIGYPRNDILSTGPGEIREQTRARLGVGNDQTAVLYAPTFRDYLSTNDNSAPAVDFLRLEELADALGPDFVILMRGHAFNARAGIRFGGDRVIDVTTYPDVAELYLAADVAIVDYSSLRFDFAISRKPMIFLVPDLDHYIETRGWIVDFEATAPGPFVNDTAETVSALQDLARIRVDYADAYATFLKEFVDLDDGLATQRLIAAVFE